MANSNKSAPAQKVEARSRTKSSYSRAGVRWTGDWTDVPKELLKDEKRFKSLMDDPMVDVRIDGNRVVKLEGETPELEVPKNYVSPEKAAQMRETYLDLHSKHETLIAEHQEQGQTHAAEISKLNERIAQLEKAAAKTAKADAKSGGESKASSSAPSSQPTITTDGKPSDPLPPVLDPAKSDAQK